MLENIWGHIHHIPTYFMAPMFIISFRPKLIEIVIFFFLQKPLKTDYVLVALRVYKTGVTHTHIYTDG